MAIIQARMGSTRLPGKVLATVGGKPLLATMLERVQRARRLDEVWVATSELERDDPIAALAEARGIAVFRGDEQDVLSRYEGAASAAGADVVVRLTADCPLIDPEVIDQLVDHLGEYDFVTNATPGTRTYPVGMDVEVMTRAALGRAAREATLAEDREHVTKFFYHGGFEMATVDLDRPLGHVRITVDTPEDFELVSSLLETLPPDFTLGQVLDALDVN